MAGTRFFAGIIIYVITLAGAPSLPSRNGAYRGRLPALLWKQRRDRGRTMGPDRLASLLVATVPVDIALLAWISGSSPRPRPLVFLGLAGGFVGIGILVGPALTAPPAAGSHHVGLGMLILLFGSLLWSIGSLYSRRARSAPSPFLSSAQTMLCGGVLMILVGLARGGPVRLHR
jgi:hypothetical protein